MSSADQYFIEENVRKSGTSFFWGMKRLPKEQKRAMFALYAFCREVDDIADEDADRLRMSLVSMMRNLPMAPRMSRDTNMEARKHNKKMVETYFANLEDLYQEDEPPRKTTSLIDRAREMNRKHPRMGSGREW